MSNQSKKQTFLAGTAILAAAVAAVKLIGFFYKEDELSFLSSKKENEQ